MAVSAAGSARAGSGGAGDAPPFSPVEEASRQSAGKGACFHCGLPVGAADWTHEEKAFCCGGCLTVYQLLTENGLQEFYRLGPASGVRAKGETGAEPFRYLDEPTVRERLLDFSDGRRARVTFHVPSIHCIACVWLLENLFRLKPGIGHSQVNFPRKELRVEFQPEQVKLSELVGLLSSLGYEPELKLADLDRKPAVRVSRRLWLQLGVAGFAFGNIMLFSLATYFGLNSVEGPAFRKLFGYLSLALSVPVLVYSAADYWRWHG